jgi:WD40 repeat protein
VSGASAPASGPALVASAAPAASPPAGSSDRAPLVVERGFGRVSHMEVQKPLWGGARAVPRTALAPQHYEHWHEKRRANVGYGYLSVVDLTADQRLLLVASEDEGTLRLYDFPRLDLLSNVSLAGYGHFGDGDFVFALPSSEQAWALFAGASGIALIDARTGEAASLSPEPARQLRWTDDHAVLGAAQAHIPEQTSRLVFYSYTPPGTLEVLATLDFAERVEEWDLDSTKRRLAVTYYPSNQTELLDLQARAVVWVAPAPQYASSVDIAPDDARVAVGGSSVVVHDASSGAILAADAHFGNNIHRVRFSPRGDALAVSSYEGKIRIFDPTGPGPGLPLRKLLRHSGTANVYALVFTPDGGALISGSGDRTVRVWGE